MDNWCLISVLSVAAALTTYLTYFFDKWEDKKEAQQIEESRVPRIVEAFENGDKIQVKENLIARPEEVEAICDIIFTPIDGFYYFIIGENGVGKTTIVKQVNNKIFDDSK
jgi:ABC-type polysaccharide/polyol phosphate transport system ATPase subunit